jgi:hypothetical protein
MEALLNFLWVVIAAVVLGFWRACWQRERPSRRNSLREWTAMGCALVLLFFAVSLTDDLHSEIFLADSFATNRNHASWISLGVHEGSRISTAAPAVLSRPAAALKLQQLHRLAIPLPEFLQARLRDCRDGRAPPESSL